VKRKKGIQDVEDDDGKCDEDIIFNILVIFLLFFGSGALECCSPTCCLASALAAILILLALAAGLTALFLRLQPQQAKTGTIGMSFCEQRKEI